MTDEMKKIIEAHRLWRINDPEGSRANLSRANLSWADMEKCAAADPLPA